MLRALFSFFISGIINFAYSQSLPAPQRLRCDLLANTQAVSQRGLPVTTSLKEAAKQSTQYQFASITSKQPSFSWELAKQVPQQSAYRILVASSPALLIPGKADYWDSNRQASAQTRATYTGKPLVAGTVHYWTVQVWNAQGQLTSFAPATSFYHGEPDPAERFAHYPLVAEPQQPKLIHKTAPDTYFLDFGKDALCQLTLHLNSPADDTVWVAVGEAIAAPYTINPKAGQRIRYLKTALPVKKGTHTYQIDWPVDAKRNSRDPVLMPAYIGEVYPFRYVTVSNVKGAFDQSSVERTMVHYPFDETAASFTSSDTILNQIWDLCKYSIKATSFTGYYVDGDRERIPYEADALINQLSHYAVDAEYSMARRSMTYLLYHPTWPTEWSLQNVLIAWNDYLYTGDDRLLQTYYPELQKKILMPLAGPNGLISTRTNKQTDDFLTSIHITKLFDGRRGLHDIVDWPQNGEYISPEKEHKGETDGFVFTTYNSVINAYYYRNLVLMQQIAEALHKPDDAAFYKAKAQEVFSAFRSVFRDAQTGLIKDGDETSHCSLHSNMFALAFGLVPTEDVKAVREFVKSRRMACSVYGSQFLMDALYDSGMGDYAFDLLTATTQRSWYNMIRVGSTISMEAWDIAFKPNLDLSHAWGAAPANLIVRKLMGVEPLTPGFDTFQIKPQLGRLTQATATIPTIKGAVTVAIKKTAATETMSIHVPGGSQATVYMPQLAGKTRLLLDGKPIRSQAGNGFFQLPAVGAGNHVVELK
ncbi:alpha-L-rhamnosidase C-terminal domain-containing protein [Spirosoma panaciterrae]|uniref:alpha-L-rhamnosidase-related protein n=1 Tax=Spirosoma panaciterrae TaxID=496058 RepID=UPI0003653BD8|nr:alpha-L-rhamnosidase C-terminal domain-containing protein [Spirosoma panaciterrae]